MVMKFILNYNGNPETLDGNMLGKIEGHGDIYYESSNFKEVLYDGNGRYYKEEYPAVKMNVTGWYVYNYPNIIDDLYCDYKEDISTPVTATTGGTTTTYSTGGTQFTFYTTGGTKVFAFYATKSGSGVSGLRDLCTGTTLNDLTVIQARQRCWLQDYTIQKFARESEKTYISPRKPCMAYDKPENAVAYNLSGLVLLDTGSSRILHSVNGRKMTFTSAMDEYLLNTYAPDDGSRYGIIYNIDLDNVESVMCDGVDYRQRIVDGEYGMTLAGGFLYNIASPTEHVKPIGGVEITFTQEFVAAGGFVGCHFEEIMY